jgi:hypothetical protein
MERRRERRVCREQRCCVIMGSLDKIGIFYQVYHAQCGRTTLFIAKDVTFMAKLKVELGKLKAV